jgi:hypothetical protein
MTRNDVNSEALRMTAGFFVVITSLVLIAGCGGSSGKTKTATAVAPTTTAVHIYAPYSEDNKPTVSVTKTVAGECFTGSIISHRSDAWRCIDGNELQDPCFAAALNSRTVICPQHGPWGAAIRLTLTKDLPTANNVSSEPTTPPAWALELTNGARCLFVAGATSIVADLRYNYQCTEGLILYGNENRSTDSWTIFGRHGSTGQLIPQNIASIWF